MSQVLFALRWYLIVQVFGFAALPLALRLFRHLPDRGYGVSKPLGLLLAGWAFWLLTTFGWTHNTAGGILVAVALLVAAGIAVRLANQPTNQLTNHLTWRTVLAVEAVFALTFVAWCVVRAHMPRIETAGGEKWMETAFLNAILRSATFPPHDPWLSGFAISYYYFGYVIMAMLARLAAVPSPIAFNLGIATLFSLTCTGAFSLVYNLIVANAIALGERLKQATALLGGLLGPLLVAVVGNLEGLLEVLHARGIGSAAFWAWLDVRSINVAPVVFAQGSWVPQRFFWWWQASRVLQDYAPWGAREEVIDEFPSFSFILGDMHPHVLALPFVLLALALALNLYLRIVNRRIGESVSGGWRIFDLKSLLMSLIGDWRPWEFLVYAICLGGLGFLNTWDFPIYLFIVAAAYTLAHLHITHHAPRMYLVSRFVFLFAILLVVGVLLYLPFWLGFRSQAGGVLPNLFNGTRLPHFLVMFGPLAFIIAAFVASQARREGVRAGEVTKWTLIVLVCIVGALALVLGLVVLLIVAGVIPLQGPAAYLVTWLRGEPIPGLADVSSMLIWRSLRARVTGSSLWSALGLIALVVAVVAILLRNLHFSRRGPQPVEDEAIDNSPFAISHFVLLLLATGALLALSVEYVYLRDVYNTRMNTVFKFYFQTWVLWGIAGAYVLAQAVRRCGSRISVALLLASTTCCPVLVLSGDALGYLSSRDLLVGPLAWTIYAYLLTLGLVWVVWITAYICTIVAGFVQRVGAATVVAATAMSIIVGGLVYPLLAIPARAHEYGGPPTLDGAAYLAQSQPDDYATITWLNEHVGDAPVILEAPGDGYRSWVYEGRVSALTGLPTLLGWGGHELQWRGSYEEQGRRESDIEKLYTSLVSSEVLTLLNKYGITYVYVGPLERSRYPADGLAKFSDLMETVYASGGVTIYRYRPAADVQP
jgi:YYY domain-containing protein